MRTHVVRLIATLSLMAPAVLAAQAPSGDWAQWRGPGRDGVVPHFTAPAKWPDQLTLRWTAEVGTGHATPILVGSRVYMFSRRGDNEVLAAFDAGAGKELWSTGYPAPYTVNRLAVDHGLGPKSTPLFAAGRIFTLGISGILSAFDASTGKRLWHKPAPPSAPTYTTSQSPLFDNGQLIVHVGGYGKGALTSFNPATGNINWEWTGDGPAYGSPIVAEFGGTRQVITFTENMLVGDAYFSLSGKSGGMFMFLDARTGELLWKGEPRTAENAAIARAGNLVFALKDDGELIVADGTTPTGFVPLARYQLSDSATWAQPSISGNRVFVKGVSTLALWTID